MVGGPVNPAPLYMRELARERLGALRTMTEKLDLLFKESALRRTSLSSAPLRADSMRNEKVENALHWALDLMQAEGLAGQGLYVTGEDAPHLPGQPGFTWFYLNRAAGEEGTISLMPQSLLAFQQAIRKGMFDQNEMVAWMVDVPEASDMQAFADEARYWLAVFQNNKLMPEDCQIVNKRYESGREVCYVADEKGKKLPSEAAR